MEALFPAYTTGGDGVVLPLVDAHNTNAFATEDHRWYYYPHQRHDEVLIIKTYDSLSHDTGAPYVTQLHSSFEDPTTPADAPYRRSNETRCLLLFPYATDEEKEKGARL